MPIRSAALPLQTQGTWNEREDKEEERAVKCKENPDIPAWLRRTEEDKSIADAAWH